MLRDIIFLKQIISTEFSKAMSKIHPSEIIWWNETGYVLRN